ncbi:MtrB/PioB family decaheme-associated outer membrane protein [Halorhodospira halophila]|uniref:MtrB/PioB family decaheme-associated outer membrane protein n=1 Tax=Halorhodospira halophila TaxID=1053 RepID=UPI001911D758|nr:MtrB/PioB family decaheme-associated outer membrane protein [Halorhodospira halophila]MBK5935280.1 hypothetical protein [Halorhodospira halophila]
MTKQRALSSALVLTAFGLPAAAGAGTPESSATFVGPASSQLWLGVGYLSEDNYHFRRYTGPVDEGFYPEAHLDLRYRGEGDDDARYGRLEGRDLGLDSRRLRGRYGVQGTYGLSLEYDERPRFYDRDVQSPLRSDGTDRLSLPEGWQGNQDFEDSPERLRDWKVERHRERLAFDALRHLDDEWKVNFSFSREETDGYRFGRAEMPGQGAPRLEIPTPVDQRTDQYRVGLEYAGDQLQGRVGYHLSSFQQLADERLTVENPDNPGEFGEVFREPDNLYHQIFASGAYAIQPGTNFSADLQLGRALQDERFVEDDDDLPSSLDGRIDTTRATLRGTHRFHPRLQVRGSYRYDDRDNRTPQYFTEDDLENRTRPHGWTRHIADVDADIRLPARSNLVLGYEHRYTDRDFTDGSTRDDTFRTRLRSRITPQLEGTVFASRLYREGAEYVGPASEAGTILPAEVYHLAELEQTQLGVSGTYSVIPEVALGAEVTYSEDDFTDSDMGLQERNRASYTLSLDYFPTEQWTGYGFVTWDDGERQLAGEQRSLLQDEETLTVGLGTEATVTEDERWSLGAEVLYASTDVDIGFDRAQDTDYPTLTTRLTQLELYGKYRASEQFHYRLAYLGQRFEEDDWALGFGPGPVDEMGDYVLMGRDNYDYTAHMVVGSVGYTF